jgi:molybdopterin molybdotransferase
MLTVSEADAIIADLAAIVPDHRPPEQLPLAQSVGRILAQPVVSGLDFPHWDNSAMDGYAVRHSDIAASAPGAPVTLPVTMTIAAGQVPPRALAPGEAARIFTGALLPQGADTVVMQEETEVLAEGEVAILQAGEAGRFVRLRGAFLRAGESLLAAGMRLGAPELAVLAAAQLVEVPVHRRVRVGLLSMGNELVAVDAPLGPGQIVDSNGYALAAAVAATGAIPQSLGRLADDPEVLRRAITAAQADESLDMVFSSGGVSVGDYDYVDRILVELGAEIAIRAVAVKPGKPLTVATLPRPSGLPLLYFGLPGNPVSALVSFWRFGQPALLRRMGLAQWQPQFVSAIAQAPLPSGGQRETYRWGHLCWQGNCYHFTPAGGSHSSGNLINLAGTNGLARIAVGSQAIAPGDSLPVLLPGQMGAIA